MVLFSDPAVGIADSPLRRAFALAERGRGATSPNPVVGCVIVRDGAIVGEGYHARAGGPHAEVVALAEAGEQARGAHLYVTLEPCNHQGKTPPCVPQILAAGIARVTIGMADPNPHVSGGGARALEAAGVSVEFSEDSEVFERQNEEWLTRLASGRPFCRVKVASSLDGHLSTSAMTRSSITGQGGRSVTMRLRSLSAAVAVGAATALADAPALTVRDGSGSISGRQPERVVLARRSVPAGSAPPFADGGAPRTLVVGREADAEAMRRLEAAGVRVLPYDVADGPGGMLRALGDAGLNEVLVEAGPSLLGALWDERLIDELVVVSAGGMAGPSSPAAYAGVGDTSGPDLVPVMRAVEAAVVGDDAVTVWRPVGDSALRAGEESA